MRRPFFLAACDIPRFDWSPMETIFKQGKLLFALAVAAVGMENLICAHVALPVFAGSRDAIPVLPFVPAIPALAYLVGFVLLAAGLSTALNRGARLEALLLAFFFLACLLVLLLPKAIASPIDLNIRTCVFEELSFAAAALTLAGSLRPPRCRRPLPVRHLRRRLRNHPFPGCPLHRQFDPSLDTRSPVLGLSHRCCLHSSRR